MKLKDKVVIAGQILSVCGGFGLATPLYGDLKDRSKGR